jgi:hypothetical protein
MIFSGKCMKLEFIKLSSLARLRKTNILCSLSCVEFIPKNECRECKTGDWGQESVGSEGIKGEGKGE